MTKDMTKMEIEIMEKKVKVEVLDLLCLAIKNTEEEQ